MRFSNTLNLFSNRCARSQSGAALLALMLIMVSGASFILISNLNANLKLYSRQAKTASILSEAKTALLMYSVTYPDNHASGSPGILPCPDINNNGSAVGNCSLAGDTTHGRFPWKTVDMGEFTDHEGEHLWYVVSDNFRTTVLDATKINSDLSGTITVDNSPDIVAVIFSPGAPLGAQDRIAGPLLASNYLEGGNEVNDNSFVASISDTTNDQVIYITRSELMEVVEKRVLGDVERMLSDYQTGSGVYPWLSTFADPATSAFRGQSGTMRGRLPFHWSADPDSITNAGAILGIPGRNPFTSDIRLDWTTAGATIVGPGNTTYGSISGYHAYSGRIVTPSLVCVQNSSCTDANFSGLDIAAPITFLNATCTWTTIGTFNCTGTFVNEVINSYPQQVIADWGYAFVNGENQWILVWDSSCPCAYNTVRGSSLSTGWQFGTRIQYAYTETITRAYTINIVFTDNSADGADIFSPTAISQRTRSLNLEDDGESMKSTGGMTSISITVVDNRQVVTTEPGPVTNTYNAATGTSILTNDGDTTGTITASIQYDIDINDGELPEWFTDNEWHEQIYIAYAAGEGSPPGTTVCTSGTDCITINGTGGTTNNKRVVALVAGQELTGQDRVGSPGDITQYFENENGTPLDEIFEKGTISNFNDQSRVLAEAP